MNTFQIKDGEMIESDTPAVVLAHQYAMSGARVRIVPMPPHPAVFQVIDARGEALSTHPLFAEACAERDRLNDGTSR